jgi:heptaprenyl diphosphate synthase
MQTVNPQNNMLYFIHCFGWGILGMNLLKSRYHEQLAGIINEIKKQADHDFILSNIDIPSIPMLRMRVLFLFLLDAKLPLQKIKQYITPLILVQQALDCHEEITIEGPVTTKQNLQRQLTILAGDYLSSKYYSLLASSGDLVIISTLARSIRAINELKTTVHCTPNMQSEDYLQRKTEIDSLLFIGLMNQISHPLRDGWVFLLQQYILLARLLDELATYRMENSMKGYLLRLLSQQSLPDAILSTEEKAKFIYHSLSAHTAFLASPMQAELEQLTSELNDRFNLAIP